LFLSRFRIRMKELALRVICGASNRSLFTLLSVEFLMSLTVSLVLGMFIIRAIMPYFVQLSGADIQMSFIYIELLIYIVAIILVSLFVFLLTLAIFRRRTLNAATGKGNKKMFRKTSIVAQLIISIVFAFCTTIILKQMYHLHNSADLGFSFKNRGTVSSNGLNTTVLEDILKQIPEVTESATCWPLAVNFWSDMMYKWIGSPKNEPISMVSKVVSEKSMKFYDLKLVAGEMLTENDGKNYVLINETAAKAFDWKDPVGQILEGSYLHYNTAKTNYTVKGVMKNVYNESPSIPAKPVIYKYDNIDMEYLNSVLFKYNEGTWKTCRDKIKQFVDEKHPEIAAGLSISNLEQEYDKLLKSENILLQFLTLLSLVCIFVCVFGFVSMVTLACEERRKEIAIRKIHGATIKDILDIFFKEQITLLIIGAVIALPIGHYVMWQWLEQYVIQTGMDVWVHLSILLALIMVIVLCVGRKIYRTSRENPVEAIKS
jgi:ABC-type antimicrobial peptide transport system permease subunit